METQGLAIPFALPSLCCLLGMGFHNEPAMRGGTVRVPLTWELLDRSSPRLSSISCLRHRPLPPPSDASPKSYGFSFAAEASAG